MWLWFKYVLECLVVYAAVMCGYALGYSRGLDKGRKEREP